MNDLRQSSARKLRDMAIAASMFFLLLVIGVTGCTISTKSQNIGKASKKLVFAKGFTPDKFQKVSLGMTKQEVRHLLGEPIGRSEGPPDSKDEYAQFWFYSWSGGGSDPIPEQQHFVQFDNKDIVIGKSWPGWPHRLEE